MNFLQRIKDSANKVSEKAQSSVEIGKLNGRISEIEREMEMEFAKMGKLFYEGYRNRDLSLAEGRMVELSRSCAKLQEKIDGIRARIAELKNERLCKCGHVVALDANFCPNCGRKLEQPAYAAPVYEDPEAEEAAASPDYARERELEEETDTRPFLYEEEPSSAAAEPEEERLYVPSAGEPDRDRRIADELERERERQLELDRRIRDWKAAEYTETEEDGEEAGVRDTVKCQICRADLPKGSMWCPRCGSEQI